MPESAVNESPQAQSEECGEPGVFAGNEPIVIAEHVSKTFENGVHALDDVNL